MSTDLFSWAPPPPPPRRREYPVDKNGNPIPADVCEEFERWALYAVSKGRKRYSSDAVLHKVRWETDLERGDRPFKANDHWTASLARWFLKEHPELPGFFELRERIDDGYQEDTAA